MLLPDKSRLITEALDKDGRAVTILSAVLLLNGAPPSKSIHPENTTPAVPVPDITIGAFKRSSAELYEYVGDTITPN